MDHIRQCGNTRYLEPTTTYTIGEKKTNQFGDVKTVSVNSWLLSSENVITSKDLRHHLDWLLKTVEPARQQLRKVQQLPDIKMTTNCLWWSTGHGGPALWPEQMRRLADLNLECSFDIYFFEDDDDEDAL